MNSRHYRTFYSHNDVADAKGELSRDRAADSRRRRRRVNSCVDCMAIESDSGKQNDDSTTCSWGTSERWSIAQDRPITGQIQWRSVAGLPVRCQKTPEDDVASEPIGAAAECRCRKSDVEYGEAYERSEAVDSVSAAEQCFNGCLHAVRLTLRT